jgi:hypothetical protein
VLVPSRELKMHGRDVPFRARRGRLELGCTTHSGTASKAAVLSRN